MIYFKNIKWKNFLSTGNTFTEIDFTKHPEDEGQTTKPLRWKVEGNCDWEAMKAHNKRIDNGTRLFGKYYRGLWD